MFIVYCYVMLCYNVSCNSEITLHFRDGFNDYLSIHLSRYINFQSLVYR